MCSICQQHPCAGMCPNAPEPLLFGRCVNCGYKIYDGNDYYDIDGDIWCEDCIYEAKKIAEVEI